MATSVKNGGACLFVCEDPEGPNMARVWQSSQKKRSLFSRSFFFKKKEKKEYIWIDDVIRLTGP